MTDHEHANPAIPADITFPDRTLLDAIVPADPDDVVDLAEEVFWQRVAQAYPMAETGDLAPEVSVAFSQAIRNAVNAWVDANVIGYHEHTEADDDVPPSVSGAHFQGRHAHPFTEGDDHVHLTHDRNVPYAHDPATLYDDIAPEVRRSAGMAAGWTCDNCEPGNAAEIIAEAKREYVE